MCMLVATCSYAGACACACAAGCAGLYRCETRCGTHSLSMGHSHSPGREGNLAAVLNPANWPNYRPHLCSWSLQLPLPPLFYRPSLTLFPRPRRLSFPLTLFLLLPLRAFELSALCHSRSTVQPSFRTTSTSLLSLNSPFSVADCRRMEIGGQRE